jgi:hypothetical protein
MDRNTADPVNGRVSEILDVIDAERRDFTQHFLDHVPRRRNRIWMPKAPEG